MTLDPKALKKAREAFLTADVRRDDDRPLTASLAAAILAYEAAKPREAVTEEEVERACKVLWPWAFVQKQAIPPSEALIKVLRDGARDERGRQ